MMFVFSANTNLQNLKIEQTFEYTYIMKELCIY